MTEKEKSYIHQTQTSSEVFLHCGDDFLLLKRNPTKRVDPGRLSVIGGRLEAGEDFLAAAIRETKEESGFTVTKQSLKLAAVVKTTGGYPEDWIMCHYTAEVSSTSFPIGNKTEDGELLWINKDKVLTSGYELVDDLNYIFEYIVEGKELIFATFIFNEKQKVASASISKLPINRR